MPDALSVEAQRQRKYRETKKEYGLREHRIWVPDTPEAEQQLRAYAYKLRKKARLTAYD